MITVFHSTYRQYNRPECGDYIGSDREKLSELLGGSVGFAYIKNVFPKESAVIEVLLPEDTDIVLSLNGEDIPRRDYSNITFEDFILNGNYFIGKAKDLTQFINCVSLGELAFSTKKVKFGKYLSN